MSTPQPIFEIKKDSGSEEVSVAAAHSPNCIEENGAISHAGNQTGGIA
jgi:hypothetical protein